MTQVARRGDRADVLARGHRFKDLTLFDLSDLALVGIDYESLPEGVETPCRFWAHYTVSDKLNGNGNPYKDVAGLEPFAAPAPDADPGTLEAILAELRAIRTLLAAHVGADPPDALRRYTNGRAVAADNPAEAQAFDSFLAAEGRVPSSVAALRQWVLGSPDQTT